MQQTVASFYFRLLGAPLLESAGAPIPVRFKKILALLVYLALEGKTSRSQLVTLLWSNQTESNARRNLRRELHRLSEQHPELHGKIIANADFLQLAAPFSSDTTAFAAALEQGQTEQALQLYKGAFLESFELEDAPEFQDWLLQKREHYAALFTRARFEFAEWLEVCGDLRQSLNLYLQLLEEDNLQERLHRTVMRLYDLLGERTAALRQFERCRDLLKSELGLSPLPETLELLESIRTALPLEPVVVAAAQTAPIFNTKLVGREDAWAQMEEAWAAKKLILLTGESGIGKTRLLLEFAASKGTYALASGMVGDAITPYSTATRVIAQSLESNPNVLLPAWVRHELARLVPHLSTETPRPIASLEERGRFFQAFAEFVQLTTAHTHTLVHDDMQFFDPLSLEMGFGGTQRFTQLAGKRCMAAFRRDELNPEITALVQTYIQNDMAVLIDLSPLSEKAIAQMLEEKGEKTLGQRVYTASGGNPFFALEVLRAWSDSTQPPTIPHNVRQLVLQRIQKLGSAAQRLLEAACLCSDGFDLETVQLATALSEWEGVATLETALNARILEPFAGGYQFGHDLMRSTLQDSLSLERQKLLHRKLAEGLSKQKGAPAQIAQHLELGGKLQQAVTWRIKAAKEAERVYANLDALEQYKLALENTDDATKFEILMAQLPLRATLGQLEAWKADLEQLENLIERLDIPRIQLYLARARLALSERRLDDAIEDAQAAQKITFENLHLGEARALEGAALLQQSQLEAAEKCFTHALELLPDIHPQRAEVLGQLVQLTLDRGETQRAKAYLETAQALYRKTKQLPAEIGTLKDQAKIALNQGEPQEAVRLFEKALGKLERIHNPTTERTLLIGLASAYSRAIRLPEALTTLERALKLAADDPSAQGSIHHTTGAVYRRMNQLGLTMTHYRAALELADRVKHQPSRIFRRLTLADLYLDLRATEYAAPLLQEARQLIVESEVHADADWCELLTAKAQRLELRVTESLATLTRPAPENPIDRIFWITEVAQSRLAAGDYAGVHDILRGTDPPPNTASQLLGIRLQAMAACGEPFETELEQMHGLQKELMPIFLFLYHQALMKTHVLAGQARRAKVHQKAARGMALEMAGTLEGHPEVKAAFLERHGDLF